MIGIVILLVACIGGFGAFRNALRAQDHLVRKSKLLQSPYGVVALSVIGLLITPHMWVYVPFNKLIVAVSPNKPHAASPVKRIADKSNSSATSNRDSTDTSPTADGFSTDNPVPDSYLKEFVKSMNQWHHNVSAEMAKKTPSAQVLSTLIKQYNKDGWKQANAITYFQQPDSPPEKPKQMRKRLDVINAWTDLSWWMVDCQKYTANHSAVSTTDLTKEEKAFEKLYDACVQDLK